MFKVGGHYFTFYIFGDFLNIKKEAGLDPVTDGIIQGTFLCFSPFYLSFPICGVEVVCIVTYIFS